MPDSLTIHDIPRINATLNATCAALLLMGFVLIRLRQVLWHRLAMGAALGLSVLFLGLYLTYHFSVPPARYAGESPSRPVFLVLLFSHVILAVAVVPLALTTMVHALKGRFDRHRRVARITLPIWLYVCVTGVTVYWLMRPYY